MAISILNKYYPMINMVKIYRNRTYASTPLIGLLSWLFSFSLQSCSIRGKELNIDSIPIERLQQNLRSHVHGCIPRETRAKFQRLEDEGFLGGQIPENGDIRNNDDFRKHFMFLFYNCLRLKEPGRMFETAEERNRFIINFRAIAGSEDLIWEPIPVNRRGNARRPSRRPYTVEFRIRDLLTDFGNLDVEDLDASGVLDEEDNLDIGALYALDNVQNRRAPEYLGDTVQVDHLFRDNSITVELPDYLHRQKTMLIDNLVRVPTDEQLEGLIREAGNYWQGRYRRGRQ